jgi:hypothetical protein
MSLLAPGFLYAAVAAALAAVALHFIVAREPRALPFPTARFVPEASTPALVRATRFSDPWLLAMRVLLLLLVGAALARPVRLPQRERIARVILADRSGVASDAAVRDAVRGLYRAGDAIVAFDTVARPAASPDSLPVASVRAPGSLSAALVAAHAAASRIRTGADSIELVVVSALAPAESDRATARIRASWPGRARVVRVAPDTQAPSTPSITWTVATRPPLAVARSSADTTGAVVAGDDVVVAPFARAWSYPDDSLRGATVVARWMDGEPAAVEWRAGPDGACERSIAIPVDSTGDLVLRPAFLRLRARLLGSCGVPGASATAPTSDALAVLLAGAGPLASVRAFPPGPAVASTLAPWLLGAAVLVAVVEMIMRARRRTGDAP